MDPVVHFEIPAEDRDRSAAFYEAAFGWQCQKLGPEMGNYTIVITASSDANGRPTTPGEINGGIFLKTDDPASHAPSVVVSVADADAAKAAVEKAGGTVLSGPDEIPGVGLYVSFRDTEGNRMSLLQPFPRQAV